MSFLPKALSTEIAAHHHLCRVDRFVSALVGRDLEGFGDRLNPGKDVGDSWFDANTAGGNQAYGVFQVAQGAYVGE